MNHYGSPTHRLSPTIQQNFNRYMLDAEKRQNVKGWKAGVKGGRQRGRGEKKLKCYRFAVDHKIGKTKNCFSKVLV